MTDLLVARLLHFFGFALWIGTLFAAMGFLTFRDTESDPSFKERIAGQAKKTLILTDIGATLVFGGGIYMAVKLSTFSQPWLHMKLTLVAILLGIHVFTRIKARKAVQGIGNLPKFLVPLTTLVVLAIPFLAVFRPFLR